MFIDRAVVRVVAGTGGSGRQLLRPVQVQAQGRARRRRRRARRQRLRPGRRQPRHPARLPLPQRSGRPSAASTARARPRPAPRRTTCTCRCRPAPSCAMPTPASCSARCSAPDDTILVATRRPRRPGQRPLRHLHPPGAARMGAGRRGRGPLDRAGAQAHRRRRPGRRAQRRQEHAALRDLRRASQDRRLSVHHAGAQPRRRRPLGAPHFVVADIPGIIEGAHEGKGLGLRFLQHVERTRVLALPGPARQPRSRRRSTTGCATRSREYSEALAAKPHVVVLTKRDLLPAGDPLPALDAPDAAGMLAISSAAGTGLEELKEYLWRFVETAKPRARRRWKPGRGGGRASGRPARRLRGPGADPGHRARPTATPSSRSARPHSAPLGAVRVFTRLPGMSPAAATAIAARTRRRRRPGRWSTPSGSAAGCCIPDDPEYPPLPSRTSPTRHRSSSPWAISRCSSARPSPSSAAATIRVRRRGVPAVRLGGGRRPGWRW